MNSNKHLRNFLFRNKLKLFLVSILIFGIGKVNADDNLRLNNKQNLQQTKVTVKGVVKDESGNVLIGVNVYEKGNSINGVITGVDGNYSINVGGSDAIIIFSYIGFVDQQISVANKTSINVVLVSEFKDLDEVIVVGYGSQKKANLTGAVGSISSDKLSRKPITSTAEGIQGLVPNLNITFGSGDPTSTGAKYNIRGNTSLAGGGPLILVDGVQMNIELINPQDIEGITILKDAASAAIYGARAAYGVILVTTKQGKKGKKTTVSYDYHASFNVAARLPELLDNTYDYALLMNAAMQNFNGTDKFSGAHLEGIKKYYEDPLNNPKYEIIEDGDAKTIRHYGYTNWQEELISDYAPTKKHNISISGGTDKTSFFASLGYHNQKGLFKNGTDEMSRYNVRLSLQNQVSEKIKINLKVVYNSKQTDKPHVYKGDENYINSLVFSDPNQLSYYPGDEVEYAGLPFVSPATYQALAGRDTYQNSDLWLTTGLEWDLIKNLKFKTDFSYNYFNSFKEEDATKINFLSSDFELINGQTGNDYIKLKNDRNQYYAYNAYFQYKNTFAEKHFVNVTAGYNQENKNYLNFYSRRNSLISNNVPAINLTVGDQTVGGGMSEWAIRGAFYRLNYIFNSKYLVEFNGRYDGTSRFPKDDRFGFFPSTSVGWRISEENFFPISKNIVSNLKLRGSYGTLGNQSVSSKYPYIPSMSSSNSNYIFGSEKQLYIKSPDLVSPSLTWERATTVNFGLDLSLLNSKFDLSFDKYTRTTSSILMSVKYPDLLGASAGKQNAAEIQTKGWGLTVNWRDRIGQDFKYNVGLSLSDYSAKVTKYDNPTGSLSEYREGQNLGEIWGYESVGIIQTQEDLDNLSDQSSIANNWKIGDMQYADLNDDDIINKGDNTIENPGDRKVIGNKTPRYSFGITSGMTYKNFYLDIFFQGIGKRDVWPSGQSFWPYATNFGQIQKSHINSTWNENNRDAYFTRPLARDGRNRKTQSRYLQNASYIRLKSLSVGYNLPKNLLSKVNLSAARISFSGQNLWEHTSVREPYDPEFIADGLLIYPLQRVYSIGVNLTY